MLKENRTPELAKEIYVSRVKAGKKLLKYQNEFISRNCPVCGYHNLGGGYTIFGYHIVICERCLMEYVNPCPDNIHLSEFYNDDLISLQNERLWKRDRSKEFNEKIGVLKKKSVDYESIIVEVGSGPGQFIEYLIENGYSHSYGIEIDERLCKVAQEKGVPVYQGDLNQEPIRNADVILCYEIIEHLIDPRNFLENAYKSLSNKVKGIAIVTCPNTDGLDNVLVPPETNGRWLAHGLFPPYHLNGFSLKNLYHLVLNIGFSVKNVSTPGKLDVEIISRQSGYAEILAKINEEELKIIQELVAISNGSAHMEFILEKP